MYFWHYRPEFRIDYKTGQAQFQILRLGRMSDLDCETIFCLVEPEGFYSS